MGVCALEISRLHLLSFKQLPSFVSYSQCFLHLYFFPFFGFISIPTLDYYNNLWTIPLTMLLIHLRSQSLTLKILPSMATACLYSFMFTISSHHFSDLAKLNHFFSWLFLSSSILMSLLILFPWQEFFSYYPCLLTSCAFFNTQSKYPLLQGSFLICSLRKWVFSPFFNIT